MKLCLENVIAYAKIGLYDWERAIQRKIIISAEIITDFQNGIDLTSVLYKKTIIDVTDLKKYIILHCKNSSFYYTEELVYSIKNSLMQEFKIKECHVILTKVPFLTNFSYSCKI